MKRRTLNSLLAFFSLGFGFAPSIVEAAVTSCDVLVVGSGAAGLSAALEAADAGCKVILLEKEAFVGGDTLRSGGFYNAPDPKIQELIHVTDSPEFFYQQLEESANGKGDPALRKILAYNSVDTLEWLKKQGVVFEERVFQIYGSKHPRSHKPSLISGTSYIQKLSEACLQRGVKIMTGSYFSDFIVEGSNVIGAFVEHKGMRQQIYAKTIVLAAGGFGNNPEMVKRYVPSLKFVFSDSRGHGSVLQKAIDLGLKAENMDIVECVPEGSFLDQFSARIYVFVKNTFFVNENGERFVDEAAQRNVISKALIAQGNKRCYTIVGSENISKMGKDLRKNLYRAYFAGQVWKANTLEELCEIIKIPFAPIKAYVEPGDSSKTPSEPPFWAVRMYPWIHYTLGGLSINTDANCLTTSGQPIPNLFAAGQITGNVHGENRLGGCGLTDAFVFGRIAGQNAAKFAKSLAQ